MEACVRLDPGSPDGHYQLSRIYRRLGLSGLSNRQTSLQEAAARRQSEESVRRTETVTKFLVQFELFPHLSTAYILVNDSVDCLRLPPRRIR